LNNKRSAHLTYKNIFLEIYNRLYAFYGPQEWWPADTRFEVIVGAILTQNTAWPNVEKAIVNLKREGVLSPCKIKNIRIDSLARIIRPAGYYNVKAKRLKNFVSFLYSGYGGSLKRLSSQGTGKLRKELLNINGIGPETCDSIMLYAFKKRIFVVDTYTKRIFSRHSLVSGAAGYYDVHKIFMDNLPCRERLFNEYHALIVRLGKEFCRTKPRCVKCPLLTCK
jgi:endonuclease III related protein